MMYFPPPKFTQMLWSIVPELYQHIILRILHSGSDIYSALHSHKKQSEILDLDEVVAIDRALEPRYTYKYSLQTIDCHKALSQFYPNP